MRALLTPEIAPMSGVVLFRPGSELMSLFRQGRVLIAPQPEHLAGLPAGALPPANQPLEDDELLRAVFENERVIQRAGGIAALDYCLEKRYECQWPHSDWHDHNFTILHHKPASIRVCWGCDNKLRDQYTTRLASIARQNLVSWVLAIVREKLGFDESHALTLPEFCWWLVRNDLGDVIPESVARKAMNLPSEKVQSVSRESEIAPSLPATNILQQKVKKVLALEIDPETPESFMLRPKRRRWVNDKYTRWVKTQPCACCNQPADDPHHLIGHGQGGMGTKAHDLFVTPLCRAHHDELHANPVAFEQKYGSQVELLIRFLDRALSIGAIG